MSSKKLIAYGTTSILISIFIVLVMVFVPLSFKPIVKMGTLILKISDAPPFMKPTSLTITIDSIMIRQEGDESGSWIAFDLNENQTFDLVELEYVTKFIGINDFPVGNYDMIKMHIYSATADFNNEEGVKLKVPSEYIKINVRFAIEEHETTVIRLDVWYDSVKISANHNLSPVVHPIIEKKP